jgi:hypothetical protein
MECLSVVGRTVLVCVSFTALCVALALCLQVLRSTTYSAQVEKFLRRAVILLVISGILIFIVMVITVVLTTFNV